jgi:penicillin-insensitive murein endopeptidase
MYPRTALLSGLALGIALFAAAERVSVAQSPTPDATIGGQPAASAPVAAPAVPTVTSPMAPATPAAAAPAAPVVAAPAAAMPATGASPQPAQLSPVVIAPVAPAAPPATPVLSAPTAPAAMPSPSAPAPIVVAPTTPSAPQPASVVAVPSAGSAASTAPLPPKRPVISEKALEKTAPANLLFSEKKLPSAGRSMAIGYYPRGCLQGGVALPVTGQTWQVMRLSRNRNWGHPELVKFLERFAPLAAKSTGWHGVLIGDMAQPRGGPLPFGHKSHQVGLDVDIWFMPMPGHVLSTEEREKTSASNLVAADGKHVNGNFSKADVAFIRTAAEQPEVERVLVNAAIKKEICRMQGDNHPAWMDKLRPWYGHNDHIHVRLKCPADSPNCRKQPAVPDSAGCGKELDYWFSDRVLHPKLAKPGKPAHPLMMSDLPPACRTVLDAPSKTIRASVSKLN